MSERGNAILRLLDRCLGIPLTLPASLFRRLFHPKHSAPFQGGQRVGIICLGAIGDLLLVSALANGLRRRLPDAGIEIIASQANAQALPLVADADSGFAFSIRRVDKILRHIRQRRYSLLFDASQWARLGNLACNLSGAGMSIGFATPGQWRSLGYDRKVAHRGDVHELENFLALGRAVWPEFHGVPSLALPLGRATASPGCAPLKTAFCHMWPARGKGAGLKQWPAACWAELIHEFLKRDFQVCLTGSPDDAEENASFLHEYFPGRGEVRSLAGQVTLAGLAGLLKDAAAVVSVNTGVMHLAALLGAPTVGLHGATNPLRWGPVGPRTASLLPRSGQKAYLDLGFEYPPHAVSSMVNLPVGDVLDALRHLGAI